MDAPKPQSLSLNPQTHLSNPQILQNYQCIICNQKSINLLRCRHCKNCLCNQCAVDQRSTYNRCPYRCTTGPLEVERVSKEEVDVRFCCPFSQECGVVIGSVVDFFQHDLKCEYINQEQKQQMKKKWDYKCLNNHPLQLSIDTYQQLIKRRKCALCSEYSITRSMCRKCDQWFCRYCRPMPIHEMRCPMGHQFIRRDVKSLYYRCDVCQMSTVMLEVDVYDDFMCNFGICGNCFEEFPKFKYPVQYVPNNSNQCLHQPTPQPQPNPQTHPLTCFNPSIPQTCSWCQTLKPCYKLCKECGKYYCFQCKRFDVMQNNQCEFGHAFEFQCQQEGKELGVWECAVCLKLYGKDLEGIYLDKCCGVGFCEGCFRGLLQYNFQMSYKGISLQYGNCPLGNHLMFYHPSTRDLVKNCSNCSKLRRVKFVCGLCQNLRCFCCQCIPTKFAQICYCGRKLHKNFNQFKMQENKEQSKEGAGVMAEQNLQQNSKINKCLVCDSVSTKNYSCGPCGYVLCKECFDSKKKDQQKNIMKKQQKQSNQQKFIKQQRQQKVQKEQKGKKQYKLQNQQKLNSTISKQE